MNARILIGLLRAVARMRSVERLSRAELDAFQLTALERLRTFACKRSPYYAREHAGLLREPLGALPILTKHALMEHFDEVVTDRRIRLSDVRAHMLGDHAHSQYLNRYWVNATSGSSGAPAIFLSVGDHPVQPDAAADPLRTQRSHSNRPRAQPGWTPVRQDRCD